ncbi:MAG: hypothetical protein LBJ12_09745 [Oscillospiraceae bacterium]|nr:hypothetical protein [Oscillospiraceae bacterium]
MQGKSNLTRFATLPGKADIIETPSGKAEFICVVGLTVKELRNIADKRYTTKEIPEKLGNPLTNYERDDLK